MKLRPTWLVLTFALIGAFLVTPFSAVAAAPTSKLLRKVPVTGTLADGGTFQGTLTITQFAYDQSNGLVASGEVKGVATKADGTTSDVKQAFTGVRAPLTETSSSGAIQTQATCQILFLDIGPIFLDLLGLQLDLSEIVLDLTAVSGAGNLLGNLLCAVAGLLDPGGFLTDLTGLLTQLTDLLTQINNLLR